MVSRVWKKNASSDLQGDALSPVDEIIAGDHTNVGNGGSALKQNSVLLEAKILPDQAGPTSGRVLAHDKLWRDTTLVACMVHNCICFVLQKVPCP